MITITKLREYDDSFRASLDIEYTNRIKMPSVVFYKTNTGLAMHESAARLLKPFLATQDLDPDEEITNIENQVFRKVAYD